MTSSPETSDWGERADALQSALTSSFRSRLARGRYRRLARPRLLGAHGFDYWWIANLVEARLDAVDRGDAALAPPAAEAFEYARRRSRGLVVDYFDDMGWMALAALRLGRLDDATKLWEEIVGSAWNDTHGPSACWRRQQPTYKNAPTNGLLALLSLRLHAATGAERYLTTGHEALAWLDSTLRLPSGVLVDGIDRSGDGRVDTGWVFSYNQGLYVGALVEEFDRTGDATRLEEAARTASAYLALAAPDGVIRGEEARPGPGGGDAGLFKGVFVRYLVRLVLRMPKGSERERLRAWIDSSTEAMWLSLRRPRMLAVDTWEPCATDLEPRRGPVFLSTQLSAVIGAEARALLSGSAEPA
ncbi:glycoside hydrolase family 76 protein [Cnuibacter sp. UC19_7]|uniref:glycoside hydrolase family 76 protein n=1 Tax=Cnuibacter sp. UC19_7 TaxID=3350166 RepID=UPI00366C0498